MYGARESNPITEVFSIETYSAPDDPATVQDFEGDRREAIREAHRIKREEGWYAVQLWDSPLSGANLILEVK